jgi:hypothetical protein
MTSGDDGIVTMRDVYVLVQQVNTRTTELMHQVNTLAARAQEDRDATEAVEEEMGKIKVKVYTAMATVTALTSILVVLSQLGFSVA